MSEKLKKILEKIVFDIFDENGIHILEKYTKKVKTRAEIDFSSQTLKMYIVYPIERKEKEDENKEEKSFIEEQREQLFLEKKFEIEKDYKTVVIDNKSYLIPDFFNKEKLKNNDEKTWEMVFSKIFYDEKMKALNLAKMMNQDKKDEPD